jgi:hypothetical protein
VNYGIRVSGPVTALTAPRVRYGVGTRPHLPALSFTRYKDTLVPRRFSNNSPFLWFSSPLPPSCTAPLVPQAAPSSTYSPARPTEPIRCGQWEKCCSATADSYSLDASVALSRRPSDPVRRLLTMTPIKRPALRQVVGDLVMRRTWMQDFPLQASSSNPSHFLSPPWSTKAVSAR